MARIDWIVLTLTLVFIVVYGIWKTKSQNTVKSYLLADNKSRWWTIGISVMATQASAITFLSTPGQAYHDGMGFVQFYFGLPLAMIVICITFIPIFHKLKVFTAYEYLESRFDRKTRTLTASLFLIQRGLAAGITIYAPAIILTAVLGWSLNWTVIGIGLLVIVYTVVGGTAAVNITQKQQMSVILLGLIVAFVVLLNYMPDDYSFGEVLTVAGASGKMKLLDFSFDLSNRYTVWTGILGGFFLFLSYFGTDQSQVQRYISGKSVQESRLGLIFNAILKIPLQFFILLLGVMVYVFFQFNQAPSFFNTALKDKVFNSEYVGELTAVEDRYNEVFEEKRELNTQLIQVVRDHNGSEERAVRTKIKRINGVELDIRNEVKGIIHKVDSQAELNDKDYVFINFILNYMPKGLIGLLLAVILCAAMSSTASELNALASTSTMDIYKANLVKNKSDGHYLLASKLSTLLWGIVAILFALLGSMFENLIQFVNIIGSIFYGTILGIFVVGFYLRFIKGWAVFIAGIISECLIIVIYQMDVVSYLWLNLIGCLLVICLSTILQFILSINKKIPES